MVEADIDQEDARRLIDFYFQKGQRKTTLGSLARVADNLPAGPGKHYGVTRENSLILPL